MGAGGGQGVEDGVNIASINWGGQKMDVVRALQFCLDAQGCPDTLSESSKAG